VNSKPVHWAPEVQTTHGWRAIILQIAMVTLASGAIAYVATNPQQLTRTVAPPPTHAVAPKLPSPPPLQGPPVTFTNPFDATEVFQFPSGTSESEARQSVAELLMQRARDRQNIWFSAKRAARLSRGDASGPVSHSGRGRPSHAAAATASTSRLPVRSPQLANR
jgi:hypothetical protein